MAKLLENIANLLDIKGDSAFRVRAYREASRYIGAMPDDVAVLHEEGKLLGIPGVGESIAAKIDEQLMTGKVAYYEQLKQQFAPGLGDLVEVPGVGPRRAKLIYDRLGIASVAELKKAAEEHKIRHLKGLGEKTEEKILRELERLEQRTRRTLLGVALPVADQIVASLRQCPAAERVDAAGSIRRRKETIGDIDILAASDHPEDVMAAFVSLPIVREVLARGLTKSSVLVDNNLQVDLRVILPEEYGAALQYSTGSKEHNVALRSLAIAKGLKLSEYGLFDESGERVGGATEEEVYGILGMPWIPPELRENHGEIKAALEDRLPILITEQDLRGDLHVHTDWSDGVDSLESMVEAARRRGYEYVAITDHSFGLGIAGGLTVDEVWAQRKAIDQLNRKVAPFRILSGVEVEIKRDGSLDYGNDVLQAFDIVTASVHSSFDQPIEVMTERMIRAVRHGMVDVVNHPEGRLLGKRPGYAVDLEQLIAAAAEHGTALEINSQPDRLDLDDVWARKAMEGGVILTISSDAHSTNGLNFMRYGVATARRAWLERESVLNTLPLGKLLKHLHVARIAA